MKKYTIKVGEVFTQKKANELIEYLELLDQEIVSGERIKAWGGFSEDRLDYGWHRDEDFKDGHFGVFRTKKEAEERYQDVRKLEIIVLGEASR